MPDSESTLQITNAKATNCNVSVAAPSSSPGLLPPSAAPKSTAMHPPTAGFQSLAAAVLGQLLNQVPKSTAMPPRTAGFQSLAAAVLGQLLHQSIQCPHGATTNVALLALQLRAFSTPGDALPTPALCEYHKAPKVTNPVATTAKRSVSGATSHGNSNEKSSSPSHSSAKVHNSLAPQSGDGKGVDSELPNGGSELVKEVKRPSKTGGGTQQLKMSDLSKYFHLNLVNAAKKLGVAQTTLKNACRMFGLERWPGRKVRSLDNTIRRLLRGLAKGQLNNSIEENIRSEVRKLQLERDQLVHGTPAQITQKMHSPAVRPAASYKENEQRKPGRPRKVPPPSKDSPPQRSGEEQRGVVFEEEIPIAERSPKRPKTAPVSD